MACVFCVVLFADCYLPSNFNLYQNKTKNESGQNIRQGGLFNETFFSFPWSDFEDVVGKNLTKQTLSYSELFIDKLTYFLELEPLVPVNKECKPPPLSTSTEINCTLYSTAFNGVKRPDPVKVAVLLQLGFDVDVLEIHLNELDGVVDKFFITESTHAHYGNIRKPLMWERVRQQDRFKHFPVIHFIVDDAESANAPDKEWSMEYLQERLRWQKFLEWNAATNYFNDADIIGK